MSYVQAAGTNVGSSVKYSGLFLRRNFRIDCRKSRTKIWLSVLFSILLCIPIIGIEDVSAEPASPSISQSDIVYSLTIWAMSDTYIDENNPDNDYGLLDHLMMLGDQMCPLIFFDIGEIPADSEILSAHLGLWGREWQPFSPMAVTDTKSVSPEQSINLPISLGIIEGDWDEMTVTWNSSPTIKWLDDSQTQTTINFVPTYPGYVPADIDLTSLTNGWFHEHFANHGFIMKYQDITDPVLADSELTWFTSREGAYNPNNPDQMEQMTPHLTVTYKTNSQVLPVQLPPPAPNPWWDDIVPPSVELSISPRSSVTPQGTIHIWANATDNTCIDRVMLFVDGIKVKEVRVPIAQQNTLSFGLQFNCTYDYGVHRVVAEADDRPRHTAEVWGEFRVGPDTIPWVNIIGCYLSGTKEWISKVLPDDGTAINLVFEGHDSGEGLKSIGIQVGDGTKGFEKVLQCNGTRDSEISFTFSNSNIPGCYNKDYIGIANSIDAAYIPVYAWVSDNEGHRNYAGYLIEVTRPFQWDYSFPFRNPQGDYDYSWQNMYDIFGHDECTWDLWDWGWTTVHTPTAMFWKMIEDSIGHPAFCFGMSAMSARNKMWNSYPTDDTSFSGETKRSIEKYQGCQISKELLSKEIYQIGLNIFNSDLSWFVNDYLPRISDDTKYEFSRPGIICVGAGALDTISGAAHALVPWFVEQVGEDHWRIYVYDSNRPIMSWDNAETKNLRAHYDDYELYPYIDLTRNGFTYHMTNGDVYNGWIMYLSYDQFMLDDYDMFGLGDIPSIAFDMFIAGASGAHLSIPSSAFFVPLFAGSGSIDAQLASIPANGSHEMLIVANKTGEYTYFEQLRHSVYGVSNKSCAKGSTDTISMVETNDSLCGYCMRLITSLDDDNFNISMSHEVAGLERYYLFEDVNVSGKGDIEFGVTADGKAMELVNRGNSRVSGKVLLGGGTSKTIGELELTVHPGEKVTVSGDWANLSASPLVVSSELLREESSAIILVVGAVCVFAVAVAVFSLWRRRRS